MSFYILCTCVHLYIPLWYTQKIPFLHAVYCINIGIPIVTKTITQQEPTIRKIDNNISISLRKTGRNKHNLTKKKHRSITTGTQQEPTIQKIDNNISISLRKTGRNKHNLTKKRHRSSDTISFTITTSIIKVKTVLPKIPTTISSE
jgi:hypothetical protein